MMTSSSLPLAPPVFTILRNLIEERLGIHYSPNDMAVLADKITPRALECGFDSLMDYYYFLRYDPRGEAELEQLVEALVVNETYFFREAEQLNAIVEHVLLPLLAEGKRPRVWCAACATGEEPLTLAMMLDERGLLDRVDLVASDISQRVLQRAQEGLYRGRALRNLPPHVEGRWLHRTEKANVVAVSPVLRCAIDWRRINLVDPIAVTSLGQFDVVLCRNVLIYFRDEVCIEVARRLTDALHPGGYLVVGVSESLLRFGTSLSCEERGGAFLYRKAV